MRREVHYSVCTSRQKIMDKQVKNNQGKVELISTGKQTFIPFTWICKKMLRRTLEH